jgi:hypothetical protein
MVDDVARELAADPPEVIVDAGSSAPGQPGFLPLLIDRPIATDGRDLDLLDPIRSFVSERYDLAATVAGWPIYILRSGSEPTTCHASGPPPIPQPLAWRTSSCRSAHSRRRRPT